MRNDPAPDKMSKAQTEENPPFTSELLVIRARLDEVEKQQREERKQEDTYHRSQLAFNKWLTILTGLLVLTNVVADVFIFRQIKVAASAADAARSAAVTADKALQASVQSFKQEQRAYLWASSFNINANPICKVPGGTRICADVHIVNSGRTPANGVHIHRYATFGPDVERVIKGMKVLEYSSPSGDVLGLVGDKWGTAATDVVDEKTAKDILEGRISLYVYGVVQYFDIFNEYHETGFCNFRLPNNGPFMTCPYGNWFDKKP